MYTINKGIKEQPFKQLQVQKIAKSNALEILSISLEKGTVFPEHTSPTDAYLIVLEGDIDLHINEASYHLTAHQLFDFPQEVKHWVSANKNSKFLIVR